MSEQRQFIFGYGSLINSISRDATGETGRAWPVEVSGYARHWAVMSPDFGMSSVAVVSDVEASCNGVVVEIDPGQIPHFDKRESGYQRAALELRQLNCLDGELPEGQIWLYHTSAVTNPTGQCPIALSYLDVIMAGCLEYGEAFAERFLATTQGWQWPLINDRPSPRYPRVQPALDVASINGYLAKLSQLDSEQLQASYN